MMDVPDMESLLNKFQFEMGFMEGMLICSTFGPKATLGEMFAFMWDLEVAQKHLVPTQVFSEKSTTNANRLRDEGNKHYKQKQYRTALEFYNLSILAAPHPPFESTLASESRGTDKSSANVDIVNGTSGDDHDCLDYDKYKPLSWGYSNRSAVFLVLKRYKECLQDIDLALRFGDPKLLKKNLLERRQDCLDSLKMSYPKINLPRLPVPATVPSCNPSIPALSNAVKLAFTPGKGRHLVATRNIRPGELLGVEESYCHNLDSDYLQSHCCVCLMECEAPLPCPTCSMVIYCSDKCRAKGQQDHWLECYVLPSLLTLEPEASKLVLAFKMLSRTPYTALKKMLPQLKEEAEHYPSIRQGFDKNGIYSTDDYTSVYHLVNNHDERRSEDFYANCIVAFVLNKLLQINGKYFVDEDGKAFTPSREDLLMTGEALFRHILQVQCNYHLLAPAKILETDELLVETGKLGIGVFPTLSLMNHSCHPTTTNYNYGRTLVLRSIRSIRAGEEITECYGGKFYLEPQFLRRIKMQEGFQMVCFCEACEKKWPVMSSLPELQIKCISCRRPVSLTHPKCPACAIDYRSSYHEGIKKVGVQKWCYIMLQLQAAEEKFAIVFDKLKFDLTLTELDCSDVCRFLELLENHVQLPCATYCRVLLVFERFLRVKALQDWKR